MEFKYGGWRSLKEQRDNNNKVSLWWEDLKESWKSKNWGGKFEDYFSERLEKGEKFFFEMTTGRVVVLCRFSRLFSLIANK